MRGNVHHSRHCPTCGTPVSEGLQGGHVCPLCYRVEEPPGETLARERWCATKRQRIAAARRVWEREGLVPRRR
ncbi:hypothetical protein ACGFX4_10945 [Kitasatospora sp. NPDC048365]|uniref:Uncharacterized protein n=1 Tax=Kitasatospora terrestris TaxID=258051 RepID=A0ABP9EKP9_9ACTN